MKTIREIVTNDDLSISDKIAQLDELNKDFTLTIEKTKRELTYGCRFCHKCGHYYRNNSWDSGKRPLIKVKNGVSIEIGEETYIECPVGHRFVDYYDC